MVVRQNGVPGRSSYSRLPSTFDPNVKSRAVSWAAPVKRADSVTSCATPSGAFDPDSRREYRTAPSAGTKAWAAWEKGRSPNRSAT